MATHTRTAGEIVRIVIETDPVIRNGLARGLINVRALARHIQVETREDTTFEGLVAAIRRYPVKEAAANYRKAGKLIDKLGMKTKVTEVTIRNDPDIPPALAKFSAEVDYSRGETFSAVSGIQNTRVIIDSKNVEKLTKLIPKRNILTVRTNLASVTVYYSDAAIGTPGFLAALVNEVAMDGINIADFIQSVPDASIVVNEKDALRTIQAVERLIGET